MRGHARTLLIIATFLTATLGGQATAQDTTLGASLGYGGHDTTTPHAHLDVTVTTDAQTLSADLPDGGQLGVRVDVAAPFDAASYPALAASVVWRQPSDAFTPYAGIGADVRWFDLDGVRCYETAARLTAGVEVPVADAVALRAEAIALTSGRFSAAVGVTFVLP